MELKEYFDSYYELLVDNKEYIEENDWTKIEIKEKRKIDYHSTTLAKEEEFKVHDSLVDFTVARLAKLISNYKNSKKEREYVKFLDVCKKIIDIHTKRSIEYIKTFKYSEIEKASDRLTEVKFQQKVSNETSKIVDKISGLNMSLDEEDEVIEFHDGKVAPLIMHYKLINLYPGIKKILDDKGIDFDTPPKNTLHILNPNPPEWNTRLHYFDQEKETLQYYVDEWKKMRLGIEIDGVYISPWMYYHMNFFVTKYPDQRLNRLTGQYESIDVIGTPPIRDNEWWVIMDNYELAKKEGLMMFLAATRRAAKTTMEASHLGHSVIDEKLELVVAGGSSTDLQVLEKNFNICQQNIHPAFRVYFTLEDSGKRIELGIKTKDSKTVLQSYLAIRNMDGGVKSKSEIFAGLTPDAVVIDEVMKLPFKSQVEGLKPAIDQPGGKRCVVILAGTAGNEDLAKDGFEFLSDPEGNGVLNMPWEKFNRMVPEEHITWAERPFGTFIPAQMSAKDGMVKVDSNLAEFLGINSKKLARIPIKITDWGKAKEKIKQDRDKLKKKIESYTREVLYYPVCPSEMLLSTKVNPFPVQEAIAHREYLKSIGGKGKRGFLVQKNNGTIEFEMDETKPLADYPFKGGFIDAPVVLYEDLPKERPADFLYVAGLDDYKQDESGTDSIGSFHIYKLDVGLDSMCGKIVASLATRPDPHEKFHHQMYLLQQAFNAKNFMENADMKYKDFLERRRVADRYLMTALDFEADLASQSEGRRKYGWAPTPKNKKILFQKMVHYCNRIFQIYDEDGYEIDVLGVQMIDDIGLLDEIIAYKEGANVDRITSFMSCLAYEDYLVANYMAYNPNRMIEKKREENRAIKKETGRNPFFARTKGKYF